LAGEFTVSFEIEKKYIVGNFSESLKQLENDFGEFKKIVKTGFWWCSNYNGLENILEIKNPKILKKDIVIVKDIGEFIIPAQDYQFARLRVTNGNEYLITFKIKNLVNKIEQNTEYEFILEKDSFIRIADYLKDTSFIFYYNVKETYEFHDKNNELKIELSKFNDLKDSYIEVEITGEDEKILTEKLAKSLELFSAYKLKEETRNYSELSYNENKENLKRLKLSQYSREGLKILMNYL
jgi:hypothetical protein